MFQKYKVTTVFWVFFWAAIFCSCSVSRQIGQQALKQVVNDSAMRGGQTGICIFEPATGKYWYNYQADKYFIPASNTKIFTCYTAMKYLGDSLTGLEYYDFDTALYISGTADPTLLHPDFPQQPVIDFLQKKNRPLYYVSPRWQAEPLGNGWAWNDYAESYMPERSPMPVYGNVASFRLTNTQYPGNEYGLLQWKTQPALFANTLPDTLFIPLKERAMRAMKDSAFRRRRLENFTIRRPLGNNDFYVAFNGDRKFNGAVLPFVTNGAQMALQVLRQEYGLRIAEARYIPNDNSFHGDIHPREIPHFIKSRPTDSMLKYMMHVSDNLFAEQSLLMAGYRKFNVMNEQAMIDTVLKNDFAGIPQRPRWADGSGLSRYNLFTPQSIVWVLNKMQSEFSMERIRNIFATGGEGTITNYYKTIGGKIFAKTGTLSNHCALSGFLITEKGKLLVFSVLTGSFPGSAVPVRRAVERFLLDIQRKY